MGYTAELVRCMIMLAQDRIRSLEDNRFTTTTNSITGKTYITGDDSFTMFGLIPNWMGCIRQGEMHLGQGFASFDLTLQINDNVFNIMKSAGNERLLIVIIKDKEDSLVEYGALSYILSSDARIRHLDTVFRNLGFYSVYGVSQDYTIVEDSGVYIAYMSFSYEMYPEERNKILREVSKLPSRVTSK